MQALRQGALQVFFIKTRSRYSKQSQYLEQHMYSELGLCTKLVGCMGSYCQ